MHVWPVSNSTRCRRVWNVKSALMDYMTKIGDSVGWVVNLQRGHLQRGHPQRSGYMVKLLTCVLLC